MYSTTVKRDANGSYVFDDGNVLITTFFGLGSDAVGSLEAAFPYQISQNFDFISGSSAFGFSPLAYYPHYDTLPGDLTDVDDQITNFDFECISDFNNKNLDFISNFYNYIDVMGSGTINRVICTQYGSIINGTRVVDDNYCLTMQSGHFGTGGSLADDRTMHIDSPAHGNGATMTSHIGINLDDQEFGTNSWAIKTAGGVVQVGAIGGKSTKFYLENDGVAHGMTSLFPTDVFSVLTHVGIAIGGLRAIGLSVGDNQAIQLEGIVGASSPSATTPAVKIIAGKKNGTTDQNMGNSDMMFGIYNLTSLTPAVSVLGNGNTVIAGTLSVPGAGTSAERFGASATAAGARATAMGNTAVATGDDSIVIGQNSSSTGARTVLIGNGISTTSSDGVAIGHNAGNWSSGVSVGVGASSGGNSVAIGRNSGGGGTGCVMLGDSATGSGTNNIGIGRNASATGSGGAQDSIGIGANCSTGFTNVIVIGTGATATAANQMVIGGTTVITDVYIGKGVSSATPAAVTLHSTAGNASGINGADLVFAPGLGGAAADHSGSLLFKTAVAGAGTTLVTRLTIDSAGKATFTGTNLAGGSGTGIAITPTLAAMNGSDNYDALKITITNANHTGTGNTLQGITIDGITFDADVTATAIQIGSGGWNYGLGLPTNIGVALGDAQNAQILYDGTNVNVGGANLHVDNSVLSGGGFYTDGNNFFVDETGTMSTVSLEIKTGGFLQIDSGAQFGAFGATLAGQQTGGAATAGALYTATEQDMLQKAYDALRTFGFLS